MTAQGYQGVAVAAPVRFGYAKSSAHRVPWFLGGALRELLRASRLPKESIDGLVIASYRLAPDNAAAVSEYLGLSPRFLLDLPYGGASGVLALRRAARAVQAGDAEVVACIAADVPPADSGFQANFSAFSRDHVHPYGAGGANGIIALVTADYMRRHGATREDFGRLCIRQRANGAQFPGALLGRPLTMAEYLAAPPVAEPLHLYDCVLRCCGAEAFLVMSEERARSLDLAWVRVAAAIERHNGSPNEPVQSSTHRAGDRDALWDQAGLGPTDMNFAQAYDDYPVIVMLQLESLGLCRPGEAIRLPDKLSINTGGGMLAQGQAGAAGSFLGMNEAIRQLTNRALGTQLPKATAGVVSCYGMVNYDRGLCTCAAVLVRGKA